MNEKEKKEHRVKLEKEAEDIFKSLMRDTNFDALIKGVIRLAYLIGRNQGTIETTDSIKEKSLDEINKKKEK